jgi:hypothetical protein
MTIYDRYELNGHDLIIYALGAWVVQKQNFLHNAGVVGLFMLNIFLECQEKKRVVIYVFHLFFFSKKKYIKISLIMKTKNNYILKIK